MYPYNCTARFEVIAHFFFCFLANAFCIVFYYQCIPVLRCLRAKATKSRFYSTKLKYINTNDLYTYPNDLYTSVAPVYSDCCLYL